MRIVSILILITLLTTFDLHAQTARSLEDYLNRAVRHIRNKEMDEALSDLNEALKLNPKYAMAYLLRADVRDTKGDKEGALLDYNRAIELAPSTPGMEVAYNNRSVIRLAKNDIDGALEDIKNAINLNSRIAAFYNQRAIIQLQKGKPDDAVSDYEKALELNPNLPSAYYGLGSYRLKQGNFDDALADYSKAIELMPSYADAYVSRGIARGLNSDLDKAISDIKKGVALNVNAVSDKSRGHFTSPFIDLCQFITSNPTNARGYEVRGILRLIQGKATESEQDFDKSLELDPRLKDEIDRVVKNTKAP